MSLSAAKKQDLRSTNKGEQIHTIPKGDNLPHFREILGLVVKFVDRQKIMLMDELQGSLLKLRVHFPCKAGIVGSF